MTTFATNQIEADRLVSLPTAATRLDVSVRGLYRLMAQNEMPQPVKVGRLSKLYESDVNAYLNRLKAQRA